MIRSNEFRWFKLIKLGCGVAALATVTAGCHVGPKVKEGAGESLDICAGIRAYNALGEPKVPNQGSMAAYVAAARRALSRIDTKLDYTALDGSKKIVPAQEVTTLNAERTAYAAESRRIAQATTAPELRTAASAFSTSPTFSTPDTELELWTESNCG